MNEFELYLQSIDPLVADDKHPNDFTDLAIRKPSHWSFTIEADHVPYQDQTSKRKILERLLHRENSDPLGLKTDDIGDPEHPYINSTIPLWFNNGYFQQSPPHSMDDIERNLILIRIQAEIHQDYISITQIIEIARSKDFFLLFDDIDPEEISIVKNILGVGQRNKNLGDYLEAKSNITHREKKSRINKILKKMEHNLYFEIWNKFDTYAKFRVKSRNNIYERETDDILASRYFTNFRGLVLMGPRAEMPKLKDPGQELRKLVEAHKERKKNKTLLNSNEDHTYNIHLDPQLENIYSIACGPLTTRHAEELLRVKTKEASLRRVWRGVKHFTMRFFQTTKDIDPQHDNTLRYDDYGVDQFSEYVVDDKDLLDKTKFTKQEQYAILHAYWNLIDHKHHRLGRREIVACSISDERAVYISTLGFEAAYVEDDEDTANKPLKFLLVSGIRDPWQLGRAVHRIMSMGTLRLLALRQIDRIFEAGQKLKILQRHIEQLEADFSNDKDISLAEARDYLRLIEQGFKPHERVKPSGSTSPEKRIGLIGGLPYRISRSKYYATAFKTKMADLRVGRIEGYQPYDQFMRRNLYTTYDYIESIGQRWEWVKQSLENLEQRRASKRVDRLQYVFALIAALSISADFFEVKFTNFGNDTGYFVTGFILVVAVAYLLRPNFIHRAINWFLRTVRLKK